VAIRFIVRLSPQNPPSNLELISFLSVAPSDTSTRSGRHFVRLTVVIDSIRVELRQVHRRRAPSYRLKLPFESKQQQPTAFSSVPLIETVSPRKSIVLEIFHAPVDRIGNFSRTSRVSASVGLLPAEFYCDLLYFRSFLDFGGIFSEFFL